MTFLHFNETGPDFFPFFDNLSDIRAKKLRENNLRVCIPDWGGFKGRNRLKRLKSVLESSLTPNSLLNWSGRADLNGWSGRLTLSAAWQESLLIRRDATLLLPRQAR